MKHFRTCSLCDAFCGLEIEHDGANVLRIRGDKADPFSRGHVCPKAVALKDLHEDPDRLRRPLKREGQGWREIGWDEAYQQIAERTHNLQRQHGADSMAIYFGNPTAHNHEAMLASPTLMYALGTRNRFSATSADQLPHMFAAHQMFGHQALFPIPDLDNTEFMVIIGGNPAASNGSFMTAGDIVGRLKRIRQRGGQLWVIDPRFTETARLADRHLYVRPGSDALLMLAVLHVIFDEGLDNPGRLAAQLDGSQQIRQVVRNWSPARVADAVGIDADSIAELARAFAGAESAAWYGRIGICTQRFGGINAWLVNLINIVTGNLDRRGGMMFTRPAVDVVRLMALIGETGSLGNYRSRVSQLPESNGELPVSAMAEEIETAGSGQIRGLFTLCGNPVLSIPNGRRLEQALPQLELMVAFDMYLNETSVHADYILPPTSPLERSHYGLGFDVISVRNHAKYSAPLFEAPSDGRSDWQSLLEVGQRLLGLRGKPADRVMRGIARRMLKKGPGDALDWLLRAGPYGRLLGGGMTLDALKAAPHGIDLGPLQPALPERLFTSGKRIKLAPKAVLDDLQRLERALLSGDFGPQTLRLIGRRHLRSNNSWLHNSRRLMRGADRCTLLLHPDDAAKRGIEDDQQVRLESRVGHVDVRVCLDSNIMPGVVSLPHGYGHNRPGVRLSVASERPGQSINDVTDERYLDELTGTAGFCGLPVRLTPL